MMHTKARMPPAKYWSMITHFPTLRFCRASAAASVLGSAFSSAAGAGAASVDTNKHKALGQRTNRSTLRTRDTYVCRMDGQGGQKTAQNIVHMSKRKVERQRKMPTVGSEQDARAHSCFTSENERATKPLAAKEVLQRRTSTTARQAKPPTECKTGGARAV